MPLILIAIAVVVLLGLSLFIWLSMSILHLVAYLFIAGVVGALADAVVPGKLPWGWLGAILAGLVGSWLGTLVMGQFGPSFFGVPIIPAFVGATVLAFGIEGVGRLQSGRMRRL
jgi:uncharacterized membrane protein YeaQ/YmgE (transglycosylase-associated protein family)